MIEPLHTIAALRRKLDDGERFGTKNHSFFVLCERLVQMLEGELLAADYTKFYFEIALIDGKVKKQEEIISIDENIITVTLRYDTCENEWLVPSPDGSEEGTYYTDDIEDAINTAKEMFDGEIRISVEIL
ncbi:hypothetical protein LCGC14_1040320 [marine sediment metagenome]|uniref:Uncharacterized protein n=1 Tax=marine sediment metagenome TaxID=412755 RepID=A0A0F9QY42_9ZZZZ